VKKSSYEYEDTYRISFGRDSGEYFVRISFKPGHREGFSCDYKKLRDSLPLLLPLLAGCSYVIEHLVPHHEEIGNNHMQEHSGGDEDHGDQHVIVHVGHDRDNTKESDASYARAMKGSAQASTTAQSASSEEEEIRTWSRPKVTVEISPLGS